MSKYFIILCLFLSPLLVKGQSIAEMTIDTATSDTSLVTSTEMVGDTVDATANISRQLYVSASRIDGNYALVFSLQTGAADQFFINPGYKITIQVSDGSMIDITSNSLIASQPGVFNNSQFIKISYPLPAESFNKLLSMDVSGISVVYDKGSFDFTTGTNYGATIKKVCQLLK